MGDFLSIEARLPKAAGLELTARLLAARPEWDIEVEEGGLNFVIPLKHGQVDSDLSVLEEACGNLERGRNIEDIELSIHRIEEAPVKPTPLAAGPFRLLKVADEEENLPVPRPDRLILPASASAGSRWWAGEFLLLSGIAEYLNPPPGAPETRGKAVLILEAVLPLAPLAAAFGGAGSVTLISDDQSCEAAEQLAGLNEKQQSLTAVSIPFRTLSRKQTDWDGRFGLIAVHLSPYLTSRRLKTLRRWLSHDGALIVSGFAPGPQTAHILRAAAKNGLDLAASTVEDEWAALKMVPLPERAELPPLTGTVVPELVELPEVESLGPEFESIDEAEEIPDEDSLMVEDEADEEE